MSTLETDRLVLRMWCAADFDQYARMCADPAVMRYIGEGQPLSREMAWRNLALVIGHWHLRGYGLWGVQRRDTGELVGRVGLWNPAGWPDLEVGWMLARPHWGHGYATEAARATLRYAFEEHAAPHVISLIHPDNAASICVAGRLGEQLQGRTEVLGNEALVYRLDREDWQRGEA